MKSTTALILVAGGLWLLMKQKPAGASFLPPPGGISPPVPPPSGTTLPPGFIPTGTPAAFVRYFTQNTIWAVYDQQNNGGASLGPASFFVPLLASGRYASIADDRGYQWRYKAGTIEVRHGNGDIVFAFPLASPLAAAHQNSLSAYT